MTTPPQVIHMPTVPMSMFGNDIFGDCVTAEEAFAKEATVPGLLIGYAKAVKWARQHWALNGAGLWEIMELMQEKGFYVGSKEYLDGPFNYVDYTNATILRNAISRGPVKVGVAADQLENVPGMGVLNGWVATGFKPDGNIDHCTSLCGYGTISWLASQLKTKLGGNVNGSAPAYAMFTWSTVGIIDVQSLVAICGEAWLRTPTTVLKPNPVTK